MALRSYNGAGLPPAPGADPDDMSAHRVRPMPPPRVPPPPTPQQLAAQQALLGEPTAGAAVEAARVLPADLAEVRVVEWPFTGTVYLALNTLSEVTAVTVSLSSERGTVTKDGATIAEAAMAALAEFEEAMARESLQDSIARALAESETQEEAVAKILVLVQGGGQ